MVDAFKKWFTKYSRSHVLSLICLTVAIVMGFMKNPAYVDFLMAAIASHGSSKLAQYLHIFKTGDSFEFRNNKH